MLQLLISWVVLTLSLWVASVFLDKMTIKGGLKDHIVLSASLGLLTAFAGWAIQSALGYLSLGLLTIFAFLGRWLTAAILLKVTSVFSDRLKIKGFGTAMVAALVMSVTTAIAHGVLAQL